MNNLIITQINIIYSLKFWFVFYTEHSISKVIAEAKKVERLGLGYFYAMFGTRDKEEEGWIKI